MNQSSLALVMLCLMTTAVDAEKLELGVRPGDQVAEFQFLDLTGRNRGKQLSQVEALGAGPVVVALVNESPYRSRKLIGGLQKLANTYKTETLAVFVAFVAGPEVQEPIVRVAREQSVSIPLGYVTYRRDLATFLPCYFLTIIPAPHFKRWGKVPGVLTFVGGVTAAAAGAIAGAVIVLARRSPVDVPTILIVLATLAVL